MQVGLLLEAERAVRETTYPVALDGHHVMSLHYLTHRNVYVDGGWPHIYERYRQPWEPCIPRGVATGRRLHTDGRGAEAPPPIR